MTATILHHLENSRAIDKPLHLAIGIFDGMHRGHQAVISKAVNAARDANAQSAILTFTPHPSRIFRPESPTRLILPIEVKLSILSRSGIDFIICQEFTPQFADIEANLFVSYLRKHLPTLDSIYTGENFRFGKGRKGDASTLKASGTLLNINTHSIKQLQQDGAPISSTRIRNLIQSGDVESANQLLGYAYCAQGSIIKGKNIGSKLGFPTLNLAWLPELQPKYGVYAVSVSTKEVRNIEAVANYGIRPTVTDEATPLLEVHVLGNTDLKPGDTIEIEWHKYLRNETKFPSFDALAMQIQKDKEDAKAFFAGRNR